MWTLLIILTPQFVKHQSVNYKTSDISHPATQVHYCELCERSIRSFIHLNWTEVGSGDNHSSPDLILAYHKIIDATARDGVEVSIYNWHIIAFHWKSVVFPRFWFGRLDLFELRERMIKLPVLQSCSMLTLPSRFMVKTAASSGNILRGCFEHTSMHFASFQIILLTKEMHNKIVM